MLGKQKPHCILALTIPSPILRSTTIRGEKVFHYVNHFTTELHTVKDILLVPTEQIHKQTPSVILRRESFWIAKLHSHRSSGINVFD